MDIQAEIDSGERFAFGRNWSNFLVHVDETRIARAEQSLREMLETESLAGRRFLDVGCGSGLFSLAAYRLGASVHSFDYDPDSVACTAELRRRFSIGDRRWRVEPGSVLDRDYLQQLGEWDVVYSWGVLHHTGAMWQAMDHVTRRVAPGGKLFIAIYNDQGRASRWWLRIKQGYNRLPGPLRGLVLYPVLLRLWGPASVRDLLRGRPFATWREYAAQSHRAMSPWHDTVDWVGGLPFEVASPEAVFSHMKSRGLQLSALRTRGTGFGCNEYVFDRASA